MWIELKRPKRIHGVLRYARYRVDYPYNAANALVSEGAAVGVDGPHEGRESNGYPVGHPEAADFEESDESGGEDVESAETEAEESDDGGDEVELALADVDLQEPNGIGPATEQDLVDAARDEGIETVSALLEAGVESLEVVEGDVADRLTSYLEDLDRGAE